MVGEVEKIVVTSSCTIGLLLLAGHLIRGRSKWLRALHLPASVVGGLVGFCFFGAVEACGAGDLADDWFADGWSVLPGFCTNIIFCSLFIGTRVPHPSEILASPRREHFLYGLIVVFGQWATSCVCTIFFGLFTELDGPFATVMPYGYAGGPVVAEAMKDLYAEDSFNYPDGYSLALLAATVGMFVGVIAGALLVNFAPLSTGLAAEDRPSPSASADAAHQPGPSRSGVLPRVRASASKMGNALLKLKETAPESDHYAAAERPSAGQQSVSVESMDTLVFHLCLVMLVMLLGYVLRIPFVAVEELFPTGSFFEKANLLSVLPLFLFCLVAGLGLQKVIDTWFTDRLTGKSFVDRATMERISNSAQDVLIVVAISRLGRGGLPPGVHGLGRFLSVVMARGLPFLLTCMAGLVWGISVFWYVAPRMLPNYWAERALVEFGVSIGATSTGLLLLRMADPENKTGVLRDFPFKQIFHVMITGGGFFDVLVPIPLTASTNSAWPLLIVCLLIMGVVVAAHPAASRDCRRRLSGRARAAPAITCHPTPQWGDSAPAAINGTATRTRTAD